MICLLPNFASIPIATLHLESPTTLQHASKLEEEIYLDVHLNHLICVHLNGYTVVYNCILHNTFLKIAFLELPSKRSKSFKHFQELEKLTYLNTDLKWKPNKSSWWNNKLQQITPHYLLSFVQVLQNIIIFGDLSSNNSMNVRKYVASKLILMYLQTFVKKHLGYKTYNNSMTISLAWAYNKLSYQNYI